ncbi:MAG: hypothetical protein J6B39_00725, partial [Lachnospiraceae bacterium]|nr:hypothetical protein [Lachnospiraceae bacterium]
HSGVFMDTQEALKKIVDFALETGQYMPTVCKCPTKLVRTIKQARSFCRPSFNKHIALFL